MVQQILTLILCLLGPIMAAQLTLIDVANESHSFNLNSLEITFTGSTLITNQGYSAPITSLSYGTFDALVETKSVAKLPTEYPRAIRFNGHSQIVLTAPYSGYATVEVFNAAGRKISSIFEGQIKKGVENTFRIPFASGLFFIHFKSGKRSETYTLNRI